MSNTSAATKIVPNQPESANENHWVEDEFLGLGDLSMVRKEIFHNQSHQIASEIEEYMRDNRWEDILSLFYPVETKLPDLAAAGMDLEVRYKLGFALGQVKKFDEAISELTICVQRDPENFHYHGSLAYTAYNSLYAAKNREITLTGNMKSQRMELAHRHFQKAQLLRPDGVSNFYREGMLYKQLENKTEKALPLFKTAVRNWESLDEGQQKERHQERKNYIKSLYQLAGILVQAGNPRESLRLIQLCLSEDEQTNYLSILFKYFALGKVNFHLNQLPEARDALIFAAKCTNEINGDFVYELLARTYLAMENPTKAWEIIDRVPLKVRRAYYRWTEADILCTMKEFNRARSVLLQTLERDKRSCHKTLIRLVRIEYLRGNYQQAFDYATKAVQFFMENWGKPLDDGLFWQAVCQLRLGTKQEALRLANELKLLNPRYEKLDKLFQALKK